MGEMDRGTHGTNETDGTEGKGKINLLPMSYR